MMIVIGIFMFVIGLCLGSFFNVVIYRLPLNLSVVKGRSMCPSCKHGLKALDLIPVFSWVFLRGKCKYCGNKISPRYPSIEMITGCLFLLAFITQGYGLEMVLYAVFWSMLLVVTMMDFDEMIIAESVLLVGTALCVGCLLILGSPIFSHLLGGLVGFGVYLMIYLLAKAFYKKEAFGFGDVELMASIGLILGLRGSIISLLLSFYIAVMGIALCKILGKTIGRHREIPFGPYMCIAAFLVSLYEQQIYDLYTRIILGQ